MVNSERNMASIKLKMPIIKQNPVYSVKIYIII